MVLAKHWQQPMHHLQRLPAAVIAGDEHYLRRSQTMVLA